MVPFKVTVPPTSLVSNPPLKVKVSPLASPNCKVPSFAKSMSLVMVEPLPLIATLATVLPTAKVVTSTSPESVVVPPALLIVKVVTPLIAPDAVMSAFAILFSVESVKVFEPPVTAPMVRSAVLVLAAFVSTVVFDPRVTAPRVIASSEALMVPF